MQLILSEDLKIQFYPRAKVVWFDLTYQYVHESPFFGSNGSNVKEKKNEKDYFSTLKHLNAAYRIPCSDCPNAYVGQTGGQFSTRVKEHNYRG